MRFGIFDHLDDSGLPLAEHYEARLALVEAYEEAGFYCYHVAEHHGTPLGHAPSPGLFFAALSQRTRTIRFGPLVYLLPLYHPLRLIEEVAMLDQLSRGRFQLGVGRGISPVEMGFFAVPPEDQRAIFAETLAVLRQGLGSDRLDHRGRFFRFDDVPIHQRPVQLPHPPLWYGTSTSASVEQCAREGINLVTLAAGQAMADLMALYRRTWEAGGGTSAAMPLVGVSRHIVVAPSDAEATALARPAYARWRGAMAHLWLERGQPFPLAEHLPEDWDSAAARGLGCAGSPARVRDFIARERALGGFTYFVAQMAFGDLPVDAVRQSARLFGAEIIPAFAGTGDLAKPSPAAAIAAA